MNIIVAKSAGYCFGVRDAVNMAYETAEKYGDVYMLGDIVHNERVVSDLEKVGAKVVKSLEEIPKGSPVLFRAHGTKTNLWDEAKDNNLTVIPLPNFFGPINISLAVSDGKTTDESNFI